MILPLVMPLLLVLHNDVADVIYPDHGHDAIPMLKLLKLNAKFVPAMKQVRLLTLLLLVFLVVQMGHNMMLKSCFDHCLRPHAFI